MKPITAARLIAAAAFLPAPACLADVALNSFGPGDSYTYGSGFALGGPQSVFEVTEGWRFTAAASGRVTGLAIALAHIQGANQFTFEIHAAAVNSLGAPIPGATLGVIGNVAGFEFATPPPPPVHIDAAGSIALTSGTNYWIVGRGSGDAYATAFVNNQSLMLPRAYRRVGEAWTSDVQLIPAMRIEVTGGAGGGCPGDLDGNGQVEPADIALFVQTWFISLTLGILDGDTDGNGIVQPADVSLFVSRWFTALVGGC